MVEAHSTLQVGDTISFKVVLNTTCPKIKFPETLIVSDRIEEQSICWHKRVIGRAFEAKRCFNLVELEDGRTLYYTRERFKGFFSEIISFLTEKSVQGGISREADALKEYVESRNHIS